MRPSVLIVEDSPSTAHLARMALSDLGCQVDVADDAARALELLRSILAPWVMVVDVYLPGVQPLPFVHTLQDAAPGAAMVLLFERGVASPQFPEVSARLFKPLQPRRFATVVSALLNDRDAEFDAADA